MKDKAPSSRTCPVQPFSDQVLATAGTLARSLRYLRLSMGACQTCRSRPDCPILLEFNAKFSTALTEIADEWGLS